MALLDRERTAILELQDRQCAQCERTTPVDPVEGRFWTWRPNIGELVDAYLSKDLVLTCSEACARRWTYVRGFLTPTETA
jgi:hypothetical protein